MIQYLYIHREKLDLTQSIMPPVVYYLPADSLDEEQPQDDASDSEKSLRD
jgi:hypothetical protein